MKRLIAVLFVVALLSGCASMSAQQKSTACSTANLGYLLADTALNAQGLTPAATTYWNQYKAGAQAVINISCGSVAK